MKLTLNKIAKIVAGEVVGDGDKVIRGAEPFETAGEDDITFASEAKYLKKLSETNAGAVIVPLEFATSTKSIVQTGNPRFAFVKVLEVFHPSRRPTPGISPKTSIGKSFVHGQDISIANFVVIGNGVTCGDRVALYPNVVVGDNVVIGDDVKIFPNVTILDRCQIGNRVVIHAGSVIGSDGFGFVPDGETYHKIPHTGIVQIDDDVEIGAGNTIDRATFGKTWIKKGVKTDNLVHIAHNVTVGENSILVAQVGISGSVTIGKNAVLAGQAGVAGHLTIGDNVIIGPQAGIAKSVSDGEVLSGSAAIPHRVWLRVQRIIPQLPELKKKLSEMEKTLQKLEAFGRKNG